MHRLSGRVAVVTGAGRGIGRAVAAEFARRGCHVAAVDVTPAGLADTVELVRALGVRGSMHVADVSDAERMGALPAEVITEHGACHVLVNNAGVTSAGAFDHETLEDLRWIVGVNVWGVVHGCHAFLPYLTRQDEAHIVNVSSMVALLGLPHNVAYAMTKGAVRSFSESLRAELSSTNVGVTTVFPGAHRTGITRAARGTHAAVLAELGERRLARIAMRSPAALARRIVRAVETGRARVVAGPDAHVLDVWGRLAPGRSGAIARITSRLAER